MLSRTPNGHLHLALAIALVASALIALATPISRTSANGDVTPPRPHEQQNIAGALQAQAATVSRALATPSASAEGVPESLITRLGSRLVPEPLLSAALEAAVGAAFSGAPPVEAAASVARVRITLHEDGFAFSQAVAGHNVGEALADLGVALRDQDAVSPPAGTPLTPGMHVYLEHAVPVYLVLEGSGQTVLTRADTIGALLKQMGISPEPSDIVFPGRDERVQPGMRVSVTTVRDTIEFDDNPIAFASHYEYDPDMAKGSELVLQSGIEGHFRREYRIHRVNGVEIIRQLVSETVLPPTDEVVAIGAYVSPTPEPQPIAPPAAAVPAPNGEITCAGTLTVYATWYTAASAGGNGVTATGTQVHRGVVATDPSVIPLGTQMYIPGYGYGVAADTGGAIIGNRIDLGFGASDIPDWGTRWVDICILG